MPTKLQVKTTEAAFTEAYKEKAFYLWYQAERPSAHTMADMVPEDERGRKPKEYTLNIWRNSENWEQRADALDGQVSIQLDTNAITERVEMLKNHAEVGKEMMEKGRMYLSTNELATGAEAIRAVVEGAQLERESRGNAAFLAKILMADEDEINKQLQKYLGKGDVVEGIAKEVDGPTDEPLGGPPAETES